jgi:hypothetical protein
MKRIMMLAALAAVLIIGLCGCEKNNPIVGKWETGDASHIVNYEFTSDCRVILDQRNSDGTWQRQECTYELKEGRLLRSASESNAGADADGCPEAENQVPVIYHINDDVLTLEALSHLGQTSFHKVDEFTDRNPNFN